MKRFTGQPLKSTKYYLEDSVQCNYILDSSMKIMHAHFFGTISQVHIGHTRRSLGTRTWEPMVLVLKDTTNVILMLLICDLRLAQNIK